MRHHRIQHAEPPYPDKKDINREVGPTRPLRAAADLRPRSIHKQEGAVTNTQTRANALAKALNDGSRTRIGDPWRGTYHVAIDVTDQPDTDQLREELHALGVAHQVNFGNRDRIAIYTPDGIEKLLGLGDQLDPRVHHRLDTIVRARGPVAAEIAIRMNDYLSMNRDPAWIAARMNEHGIVDGMGGQGWNPRKVKAAARGEVPARLRKREAA
jgi:hypothetical protein